MYQPKKRKERPFQEWKGYLLSYIHMAQILEKLLDRL